MSVKIFQDNIFPKHVSDLMNLMHMVVFKNTDGEEKWNSYLSLRQKEYVALSLAQYYQCEHCVEHHLSTLCQLEKISETRLCENVNSMVLFLRIDSRTVGKAERDHWINAWKRFTHMVSKESNDEVLPYLIGLSIGIARDDAFLIQFCGEEVIQQLNQQGTDAREAVGELESVVIFMKAAASKNRVVDKIEKLFA